jgi:hypothetical protein
MSGRGGAMFVIVGFAALLLIIAVFSSWQGAARLTSRGDDTKDVEAAARAFVQAFGTFDFREPDVYRQRLLGLTAGTVREATLASSVDPVAVGQQRTLITRVVSVSVTALSGNTASVSVTAEQLRRSVDAATGELVEERVMQRVVCRLERQGNAWLVAEFRLVSEEPVGPTPRS